MAYSHRGGYMFKKVLFGLGLSIAASIVVSYVLANQHKKALEALDD